jgi:hypothetical protein
MVYLLVYYIALGYVFGFWLNHSNRVIGKKENIIDFFIRGKLKTFFLSYSFFLVGPFCFIQG